MNDPDSRVRAAVAGAPMLPPSAPKPPIGDTNTAPTVKTTLAAANTHHVAIGGMLVAGGALALHVAAMLVQHGAVPSSPLVAIVLEQLDVWVATPALAGGATAAFLGKPPTV